MKITNLRVFLANPGRKVSWGTGWGKNAILVKIYTDEGIDEEALSAKELPGKTLQKCARQDSNLRPAV